MDVIAIGIRDHDDLTDKIMRVVRVDLGRNVIVRWPDVHANRELMCTHPMAFR